MKNRIISIFVLLIYSSILFAQNNNYAKPNIYAVIVGISDYIDPDIPNLKFPEKDAIAFYNFLRSEHAGEVPEENISLLTGVMATRSNVLSEMVEKFSRSTKEDMVIFYFSGHGRAGEYENTGYLLSFDALNGKDAGTALSMDDVKNKIDKCQAKMKISYIDACHAGLFKSSGKGTGGDDNSVIVNAYLDGISKADGGNISFLASSARQQSTEDEKLGHGVFTYYLLQGLKGDADIEQEGAEGYNNGIVTSGELGSYLINKIQKATKYKQKPTIEGDPDGLFPLSVLRTDISISTEIAKQSKKETKSEKPDINLSIPYKTPPDEILSSGMASDGASCYGQIAFVNKTKNSLILSTLEIKTNAYQSSNNISIKLLPNSIASTPRLLVNKATNDSNGNCNDYFTDYVFSFQKIEEGVIKYATIYCTVESRKKKYLVLSDENLAFR